MTPLIFLGAAAALNILLDLQFVLGFGMGVGRGGGGHCAGAVSFRRRDYVLHAPALSPASDTKKTPKVEEEYPAGDRRVILFNLRPAVGDEFRDLDGAGFGEQLWGRDHGGFCGGSQNRFFRLYAGAGFRQCIFYLRRTELRGRENGQDTGGNPQIGGGGIFLLRGDQRRGLPVGASFDDDFYSSFGNGDYQGRRALS